MNVDRIMARLERFAEVLPAMVKGLDQREACWKPPSGAWSILEIVCHLADEEVEDFRTRLRLTQEDPAAPWPGIDPVGWAKSRSYGGRSLEQETARFVRERRASVAWLRSLARPDWEVTTLRPHGPVRAGDLLVSWSAHDALHARQIAKRLFELAGEDGKPEGYSTRYAGEWGA